jgi:hypothetical protein
MTQQRPVLYLDLDDTVLSWADGSPAAGEGACEFVLWTLERFDVRWLTRWCPNGEMSDSLLADLGCMLGLPASRLRSIRGVSWEDGDCKVDGIAWLEHVVLGRPFVWIEDDKGFGSREAAFLRSCGYEDNYIHCNVTRDAAALRALRRQLARWLAQAERPRRRPRSSRTRVALQP